MPDSKLPLVTIFTPTYNRASYLPRLHRSLAAQERRDLLCWLVVDDGSTDGTEAVVADLARASDFSVRYVRGRGRGKHDAFNLAIEAADTELFFCVDSDDLLSEGALPAIERIWKGIRGEEELGGFAGATVLMDGKPRNGSLPSSGYRSNTIVTKDRLHIHDVPEVYRTAVLKRYRFPVFEGERFLNEAYLFDELSLAYPLRYFEDVLMAKEYLEEGLSAKIVNARRRSPRGALNYYARRYRMTRDLPFRVKALLNFVRFSAWAPGEAARLGLANPALGLAALLYAPVGWAQRALEALRSLARRPRSTGGRKAPCRITVVEPVCDGRQHEVINAAMVLAAARAAAGMTGGSGRIRLVCDPGHEAALRAVWERHDLAVPDYEYRPYRAGGRFAPLRRLLLPARLGLGRGDLCLATFQDPLFALGTNLSACRRFRIAEHGFLSSFRARGEALPAATRIKNAAKLLAFVDLAPRCSYLLFGGSIHERAVAILPRLRDRFIDFPLPYLFHDAARQPRPAGSKTRIAQLVGAHVAGLDSPLFAADALLKGRGLGDSAELELHGVFSKGGFVPPEGSGVRVTYKDGLVDGRGRDSVMAGADYLVFAPPPDNYRLMASGAIFDALSFCVPVIALRNDYFAWVEGAVGPIGILVDRPEELPEAIADAVAGFDRGRHEELRRGMLARRERLGVDATARLIGELL
jgi:glycosyltransferase involved in cell wall biosynthesis